MGFAIAVLMAEFSAQDTLPLPQGSALMFRSFTLLVAAFAVSISCNSTQAGILVGDWKNAGDGLLTIDTAKGLEFLDVTESRNRTFNEVTAEFGIGGDYEGFRYATEQEAIDLILSIGWTGSPALRIGIRSRQADVANDEASRILDLLGRNQGNSVSGLSRFMTKTDSSRARNFWIVDSRATQFDYVGARLTVRKTTSHFSRGSLLVRSSSSSSSSSGGIVPEPSSLTMFGVAGLGLLVARRRR